MNKKQLNILLVDDNEADNYIHRYILENLPAAIHIDVVENGAEALEYLNGLNNEIPEILLLDVNMPLMNGWEFLQAYKQLDESRKAKVLIVMLTTEPAGRDLEQAKQNKDVTGFMNKPLEKQKFMDLIQQYFPDHI